MHMADALLSPAVGAVFIAASGTVLAVSAKKLKNEADDRKVPLMGVMGAFIFAAQMINFTIPGTGSSGHLGGGMLLTMLLGPYAAFITIASVLIVQALFFADGGILALGTNIWNMGFYSCFIGWAIFKTIAGKNPSRNTISFAAVIGSVASLELGAFSVVIETLLSGRSELPFGKFCALMLGIHFPISLMEGIVTIAVVNFVYRFRAEIVKSNLRLTDESIQSGISYRPVIVTMALAALLIAGFVVWFASAHPDGLEWSLSRTYGKEELPPPKTGIISTLEKIQEKTAFLPDYSFKSSQSESAVEAAESQTETWPNVSGGTSVSGIIGSIIVLSLLGLFGLAMVKLRGNRRG